MIEYVNKEKLARAEAEAHVKGGDVMAIYVRLGGLLKEDGRVVDAEPKEPEVSQEKEEVAEEAPKKSKKK